MKKLQSLLFVFLLLIATESFSKNQAKEADKNKLTAVTVFIDINQLSRKKLAAKKMTKSHQDFAEFGYQLIDVSPYTENGDLEGFFVSYQKK